MSWFDLSDTRVLGLEMQMVGIRDPDTNKTLFVDVAKLRTELAAVSLSRLEHTRDMMATARRCYSQYLDTTPAVRRYFVKLAKDHEYHAGQYRFLTTVGIPMSSVYAYMKASETDDSIKSIEFTAQNANEVLDGVVDNKNITQCARMARLQTIQEHL